MTKIKKHIEIVRSSTPLLSSLGVKTSAAIQKVLRASYTDVNITIVNNFNDLEILAAKRPDIVFIGMKYIFAYSDLGTNEPDKIWVSQYLEDQGIVTTGSDHSAYQLEFDKPLAKKRVLEHGLATPPFCVIPKSKILNKDISSLDYPVFVKPTNMGGGRGIDGSSVVHDFKGLQSKVSSLTIELNVDSLVEKYLNGREFSVAILKQLDSDDHLVMPLELIAPLNNRGDRVLSAKIKSEDSETHIAVTDKILLSELSVLALDVFNSLGARDYGRVDIRLDSFGVPHFLEANLIPSLLDGYGNFPKACMLNLNLSYENMINHIVELAIIRNTFMIEEPETDISQLVIALPAIA